MPVRSDVVRDDQNLAARHTVSPRLLRFYNRISIPEN